MGVRQNVTYDLGSTAGAPHTAAMIRPDLSRLAIAAVAATASLLTACGSITPVSMSDSARARIHVVSVDPDIKMPPEPVLLDRGQSAAMMLGGPLLGAAIANNTAAEPRAQLVAEMQTNHIVLGDIVASEFSKKASAGGPMKFEVGTAPADAQVHFTVTSYGLAQAQPFGSTLYPLINVSAVMQAPDGTILWQAKEIVGALDRDNKQGQTFADYAKDPELLRQAFASVSAIASHKLTDNLMGLEKAQGTPGIQQ